MKIERKAEIDGGYDSLTILPPPAQHVTTTKPNIALLGIFDPNVTLTLDLLFWKFDVFILGPKSVSGESLVKFHQHTPKKK